MRIRIKYLRYYAIHSPVSLSSAVDAASASKLAWLAVVLIFALDADAVASKYSGYVSQVM